MTPHPLDTVARLAHPNDNAAIATRDLQANSLIRTTEGDITLSHPVLEGHRFAVKPLRQGNALLSWGYPFGEAATDIAPGSYLANHAMLAALRARRPDLDLPTAPTFTDRVAPFVFDEASFVPAEQVAHSPETRTFMGYARPGGRGVGTRNHIVLLALTSSVSAFVTELETRFKAVCGPTLDGVVAVAHTEGGVENPNNLELLLRTLAGFAVHPNVGAVLLVDDGAGAVTRETLKHFMAAHDYPLEHVLHDFLTLTGDFAADLAQAERRVRAWQGPVGAHKRTAAPLEHLKVALQCGGSDAFSGISGNPLAAWVARELIRHGGSANLAETDELIGAEAYALARVKDLATVRRFLALRDRFQTRAAWHGASAAGNPSGGNLYRGLYNITLKSLGAATKRHPEVRLDAVLEYAERMTGPGYYFMDSPGNDLESIAGQVAAGCNLIFFITGNGSITNFPFVPTLKVVTTTARYQRLRSDMDVNAGAYLDGTPLETLGAQMFKLTLELSSGQRSVGERAGHAQVQIWRDWPQRDGTKLEGLKHEAEPAGIPLASRPATPSGSWSIPVYRGRSGNTLEQVGLILPTSLCAGQVARLAAERLNAAKLGSSGGLSRFVTLVHTEGCGVSSGPSEDLYARTLLGYLQHPRVAHALLLEHGCEKTHNDYMRGLLRRQGLEPSRFGWASIQQDGGIEAALERIEAWFAQALASSAPAQPITVGLERLRLGLMATDPPADDTAGMLADMTRYVLSAGGTVVLPQALSPLLSEHFCKEVLAAEPQVTLSYGQRALQRGLHVMRTPTTHWAETLTGLAATGVEGVLAYVTRAQPGHPLIPLVQLGAEGTPGLDLIETDVTDVVGPEGLLEQLLERVTGRTLPTSWQHRNVTVQLTRGPLGVSL